MRGRTFLKRALVIFAVCLAFGIGMWRGGHSANAQPVTQEEYDQIVAERDALQAEMDALQVQGDTAAAQSAPEPTAAAPVKKAQPVQKDGFDPQEVAQQLITKTYQYTSYDTTYVFLVVENTSEYNLDLLVDVTGKNAEGGKIGAKQDEMRAVSPGSTILLSCLMDEEPAEISYEYSLKQEERYQSVTQNLSHTSEAAKNKEIVSVTNNGDMAVKFVQGTILFFSNGRLVNSDWTYFVDNDYELKPGKTISKEMKCRETYDSYEIYFSASA